MVQSPHYTGPNVAVEAIFNSWESFCTSKQMWRPNPKVPRGDVAHECCIRTLTVSQLSEHRPVHSVPPTQPLSPMVLPVAPHVDEAEFPKLTPSPKQGIGGIPGTKDFPQGTFKGFEAFKKPDESMVVPCSTWSKAAAPSTTMATVSTPSSVVATAVPTTVPPPLWLRAPLFLTGGSNKSQKSTCHGCPRNKYRIPMPSWQPRLTQTRQGKGRPRTKVVLQKSLWKLARLPPHLGRTSRVVVCPDGHPFPIRIHYP